MIEIERVRKAGNQVAFLVCTYMKHECRQAKERIPKLAGNFAIKESAAKALGTGFRQLMPMEIEVFWYERGKPYGVSYGGDKERAEAMGMKHIHAFITNTVEYAFGFVVGEGED